MRVRERKKWLTVVQVGESPYVRMRVRVQREIVRTVIAPCSDSVRKIQFAHTYKSQNSDTPRIRSPWLVTRRSIDSQLFVHVYITLSKHVLPMFQQNAGYQSFLE